MTSRRAFLAALAVAATAAALPSAANAANERQGAITSFDGTKIAWFFFPADNLKAGEKAPVAMMGPGYSMGHSDASDKAVIALRKSGYDVLTWDPRGFGNSGGSVEIDSPAYEGRDAQALIDLLAGMPDVQLDAPGDPHLGMLGASYGGGIQNALAAIDKRVDVIAPQIAWNSLITSLDKNDTAKGGWGSLLYGLGTEGAAAPNNGPTGVQFGRMQDPAASSAIQAGIASGAFTQDQKDFFASRGPQDELIAKITVPTLISQGTDDTLFTLHEAIRNFGVGERAGVPISMIWFCGGLSDPSVAHGVCLTPLGPQPNIVLEQSIKWLDRYLKGDASVDTGPRFRWVSDRGALRYARDYPVPAGPPVSATGTGTLATTAGDTSGELIVASRAPNAVNVPITAPAGTQLLGEPTLSLTYSGTAASADGRVYAQIVDEKTGYVLGNQATPVKVNLDGTQHTLELPLEAVASDAVAGSGYTLQIIGGTSTYFAARQPSAITFSKIAISIPTVANGASSEKASDMRSLPAPATVTATCTATKAIVLRLHARKGTRLIRARLYVDGKLARTLRGHALQRLTVKGLGRKPHVIRVDTFTKKGLAVRSTRRIDACGAHSGLTHKRAD